MRTDRIRLLSYNRSSIACDTVASSAWFTHLLHENVSGAMFYPGEDNAKSKGMLHRDPPNACKHRWLEHYKCSPRVLFWFSCVVRSMIMFLCQFAMDYPRWMILQMTNPNPTVSAASIACIYVVSMYSRSDHVSDIKCTDQYCDNFSRLFSTLPLVRSYWSL